MLDFTHSIAALDISDHKVNAASIADLERKHPDLYYIFDHLHMLQDHFEDSVPTSDYEEIEKEAATYEERLRDIFDRLEYIEKRLDAAARDASGDLETELDIIANLVWDAKDSSA